jgi:biopolymer transport protein ExbD
MAGVDVGGAGGRGRRSLDSQINMIPMIDLLMVTISFLLITAVWTHMARIGSDANVPGPARTDPTPVAQEKELHVLVPSDDKFVLAWKQGATTIDSVDVPRRDVVVKAGSVESVRFPDLADKIATEWKARGQHAGPGDRKFDRAVLHTDDRTEFKVMIGVMDAIYATRRDLALPGKTEKVPAFNVTFAVN